MLEKELTPISKKYFFLTLVCTTILFATIYFLYVFFNEFLPYYGFGNGLKYFTNIYFHYFSNFIYTLFCAFIFAILFSITLHFKKAGRTFAIFVALVFIYPFADCIFPWHNICDYAPLVFAFIAIVFLVVLFLALILRIIINEILIRYRKIK
jgi:hypothetical protein